MQKHSLIEELRIPNRKWRPDDSRPSFVIASREGCVQGFHLKGYQTESGLSKQAKTTRETGRFTSTNQAAVENFVNFFFNFGFFLSTLPDAMNVAERKDWVPAVLGENSVLPSFTSKSF